MSHHFLSYDIFIVAAFVCLVVTPDHIMDNPAALMSCLCKIKVTYFER